MNHRILQLPINNNGRDFFVSSIFGRFDVLETILKKLNYNNKSDRIITTGNMVNYGIYSELAINWLSNSNFYSILNDSETEYINKDIINHFKSYNIWWKLLDKNLKQKFIMQLSRLPEELFVNTIFGKIELMRSKEIKNSNNNSDWILSEMNTDSSLPISVIDNVIYLNYSLNDIKKCNGKNSPLTVMYQCNEVGWIIFSENEISDSKLNVLSFD